MMTTFSTGLEGFMPGGSFSSPLFGSDLANATLPSFRIVTGGLASDLPEDKGIHFPSDDRKLLNQHWHRGTRYGSRSEAACGELLERFVLSFQIVDGQSFQIPILENESGIIKVIDFKVAGHLVEYHPPRHWRQGRRYGDFPTAADYFEYRRMLKELSDPSERRRYKQKIRTQLTQSYFEKRKVLIDQSPAHRGTPLIVVTSPEQFFEKVIKRFGHNIPDKRSFVSEFKAIEREVKDTDRDPALARYHRDWPHDNAA